MLRGRLLLWLLVLVLGPMTVWLAAERNARRWTLAVDHDQLLVSRGRNFLFGTRTIEADDPELGKIYGPIPLPAGSKVAAAEFADQFALDRALFEALLPLVRTGRDGDAAARQRAEALLGRLSGLPGLTAGDLDRLTAMRGDFAYDAARGDVREALRLVRQAWRRLQAAGNGDGEHALEASRMATALPGVAATLDDLTAGRGPAAAAAASPPAPERR